MTLQHRYQGAATFGPRIIGFLFPLTCLITTTVLCRMFWNSPEISARVVCLFEAVSAWSPSPRPPAMAPRTNSRLRELMVHWYYALHWSTKDIASHAQVSVQTVYNILNTYDRFGAVWDPTTHPTGRKRTLDTEDVKYVSY